RACRGTQRERSCAWQRRAEHRPAQRGDAEGGGKRWQGAGEYEALVDTTGGRLSYGPRPRRLARTVASMLSTIFASTGFWTCASKPASRLLWRCCGEPWARTAPTR